MTKTRLSKWLGLTVITLGLLGFGPDSLTETPGEKTPESSPLSGNTSGWSPDLPVVSDGRHLWLWADKADPKDTEQKLTALYHADVSDEPFWESVTDFAGRLTPRGVAAENDTLWMVFEDGGVQVVSLRPAPIEGDWYLRSRTEKSLPGGATVRASMAADGRLWVLARFENAAAVAELEKSPEAQTRGDKNVFEHTDRLNLVLGLPRGLRIKGEGPEETEEAESAESDRAEFRDAADESVPLNSPPEAEAETPEASDTADESAAELGQPAPDIGSGPDLGMIETQPSAAAAPVDRLLVLESGYWRLVTLPEAWPTNRPTRLITPARPGDPPTLLVKGARDDGDLAVTVFRPSQIEQDTSSNSDNDEEVDTAKAPLAWSTTTLQLPAAGGVTGLRVRGQLLLVQNIPTDQAFAAQVWAVRGDRLTSIGKSTLADSDGVPPQGLWSTVDYGDAVGLLAGPRGVAEAVVKADETEAEQPPGPTLTAVDLNGRPTLAPVQLEVKSISPLARTADTLLLLAVAVVSTVLLFSFWRRDPTTNNLELSEDQAVADLLRRGLAGLIDIAPGLWVAATVFGLPYEELYDRWPGRSAGATWDTMLPGLLAVGVVVGHTLVLELATGRSLGKWATGLRVVTLSGDRPKPWQIVARCLLKSFDLIAYLLLLLPVISPLRQRLGDIVARTVVVAKAPPIEDEEGGSPGGGG
ncbi:MAG: RDD family protein [Planctomycetota bacterium]